MRNVAKMTRAELLREKERNSKLQTAANDKLIALGYGNYRMSEIPYDVPERTEYIGLQMRWQALAGELDRIQLGYRKATPSKEEL